MPGAWFQVLDQGFHIFRRQLRLCTQKPDLNSVVVSRLLLLIGLDW